MQKLFSAVTALAMVASLATGAFADDKMMKNNAMKGASTNASSMGKSMSHKCAPGKSWVRGYTNKNGKKVKGYCR